MAGYLITPQALRKFALKARPDVVASFASLQGEVVAAGLTSTRRVSEFLANVYVESWGLSRLEEDLNYSAQRLREVWPRRFPSIRFAEQYANNPERLADFVYGNRMGNFAPGDGWTFRGSGLLDTTGRTNYREAGHENDPETLRTPIGALRSALSYWTRHQLNALADAGKTTQLRIEVNGGENGLNDVFLKLRQAEGIFV